MPLNHFYASYAPKPADLASVDAVRKGLNVTGSELMALRLSPPAQDYTGPVLFEARAAAPLVAQVLGPALNGARPPVAFQPVMEQFLSNVGGKSDWVTRIGARVLPTSVTVVDDPGAKDFGGKPLIGGYRVDDEGVPAEKVTAVENGMLKELLMSRRPGPDSDKSNGHGRSAFLNDAKPTLSNLFFTSTETVPAADLRKKFLDICKANKQEYCLEVKEMDNPAISLLHQEDFSRIAGELRRRRGKRRPVAAAGVSGVSGGRTRRDYSRSADYRIEYPSAAERDGDRQRSVRVQLHANAGGGICRDGAGRIWLGTEWIAVVGGGAVIVVRRAGCARSARRTEAAAVAACAGADSEVSARLRDFSERVAMNELTRRGLIFGAAALVAVGVFAGVDHVASQSFVQEEPPSAPDATVEIVEFDDSGKRIGKKQFRKVHKTLAEWRNVLTAPQFAVTRQGGDGDSLFRANC